MLWDATLVPVAWFSPDLVDFEDVGDVVIGLPASVSMAALVPVVAHITTIVPASSNMSAPGVTVVDAVRPTAGLVSPAAPPPTLVQSDTVLVLADALATMSAPPPFPLGVSAVVSTPASVTLDALPPTILWAQNVVIPAGALVSVSATTPAVLSSIVTPSGHVDLSSVSPLVDDVVTMMPVSGLVTVAALPPTLVQSDTVVSVPASVTLEGVTPGLFVTITVPPGEVVMSAVGPTIPGGPVVVASPTGTLTMSMPDVVVLGGDGGGGAGPPNRSWFILRKRRY